MRHWRIWLYLVGMLAIFGSCFVMDMQNRMAFPSTSNRLEEAQATKQPAETASPAAQATVIAAVENTEAPTQAPTETAVAVVTEVDQCLECHTDKAQLIDTAAPEEEVVKESEGAG